MSQQRQLETLRARRQAGERPVVRVGDDDYEFAGVVWGGASPLVSLLDPSGRQIARTAAEWTRGGARFLGRSRDLAKVRASRIRESPAAAAPVGESTSTAPAHRTPGGLMADVERYLAEAPGSAVAGVAARVAVAGRVRVRGRSQRTGAVMWLLPEGTPTDREAEAGSFTPAEATAVIDEYRRQTRSPVTGASRWDLETVPDTRGPAAIRIALPRARDR